MSAGKGKIARLPFEIRQQLNQRMRDGVPDVDLVQWLNGLPGVRAAISAARFGGNHPARWQVTAQNLSEYRSAGYAAWLREQDRVENVKALAEFSMRLAEAAGGDVTRPAVAIAAGKIMEALEAATVGAGKDEEGPDAVKIAGALAGLSLADTAAKRVNVASRVASLKERVVTLDEKRFQRQTAELFLKWYADKRAREIAEGKGAADVKMDQLITLMFGERNDRGEA